MFAGIPQYPDLAPWVSQQHGYIYGWSIDTSQIAGRTLLRLSNAAINMGQGPMELTGGATNPDGSQQVFQRVYASDGSSKKFLSGNFVFHAQHNHVHFEDFTQYNLRRVTPDDGTGTGTPGAGTIAASGDKVSFCLLDSLAYDVTLPGAPLTAQNVTCSNVKQGISVGWADLYDKSLFGQWVDVTDAPSGRYWLEVVIDPMNRIAESNERNNVARIMIDVHHNDNALASAYEVGALGGGAAGAQTFREFVGSDDTLDYYKFTVANNGTVNVNLSELRANADLQLLDGSGAVLASSVRTGTNAESIARTLAPGTYYVRTNAVGTAESTYTLGMTFTSTAAAGEDEATTTTTTTTTTKPGPAFARDGWADEHDTPRHGWARAAEQLFGADAETTRTGLV
jgi:hypothetical protein